MEALLSAWFRENGRDLPWRETRDPYAILVSEVMLQQTQVDRVVPRYREWVARWPTARSLAAAPTADVIRAWQGLGYNRRGVNLQRAARLIVERGWPADLTELPGVGPYTAAAIANFAIGMVGSRFQRGECRQANVREFFRRRFTYRKLLTSQVGDELPDARPSGQPIGTVGQRPAARC